MTDQHVAGDESWGGVCACHLHLTLPKCFLVFIPVDTVRLLWKKRHERKQGYLHYMYNVFYVYNITYAWYFRYLISFTVVWEHDNSRHFLLVDHRPEVSHGVWQWSLCYDEGAWAPVTLCGKENTSLYCCTHSKQIGYDEFNYTCFKTQLAARKMWIHSELMR